jgi:hypothetical protein
MYNVQIFDIDFLPKQVTAPVRWRDSAAWRFKMDNSDVCGWSALVWAVETAAGRRRYQRLYQMELGDIPPERSEAGSQFAPKASK